jgi:hypothetical protein
MQNLQILAMTANEVVMFGSRADDYEAATMLAQLYLGRVGLGGKVRAMDEDFNVVQWTVTAVGVTTKEVYAVDRKAGPWDEWAKLPTQELGLSDAMKSFSSGADF